MNFLRFCGKWMICFLDLLRCRLSGTSSTFGLAIQHVDTFGKVS